jgi:DNA-directed RNA polymerase specialized sigma24 family protein
VYGLPGDLVLMSSTEDVTFWIARLKEGDPDAAQRLWGRYFQRLVRLAHRKLRDLPRGAADEEDVALSAFDSFCRGAEDGRFPRLNDRDDLWQLLVVLAARKAGHLVRHERRQKRGGGRVRNEAALAGTAPSEEAPLNQVVGREPTPEFAAQVVEECRRLLDSLADAELRSVALWKMEGYTNEEIAGKLGRELRTVERRLRLIRKLWSQEDAP